MKDTKIKNMVEKFLAVIILFSMFSTYLPTAKYAVMAVQENLTEDSDLNVEDKETQKSTKEEVSDIEEKNEEIILGEKLKESLIEQGIDTNQDGIITEEEVNNFQNEFLYISAGDDELDLTGIEYLTNLEQLSIYTNRNDIDFQPLNSVNKLRKLNLSGNIQNIDTLQNVVQLKELSLNFYDVNSNADLSAIENMTNLESLSLYIYNEDISVVKKLKKLKTLNIEGRYNRILTNDVIKMIEGLSELETLNLSNINAEDLSRTRKTTKP